MSKHTPGPWVYEWRDDNSRNGGTQGMWGADGSLIFETRQGRYGEFYAPSEADTCLMAKAPEMLAVLKVCKKEIEVSAEENPDVTYLYDLLYRIELVIAEATGDDEWIKYNKMPPEVEDE